jgi:hypothetical protein
MSSHALIVEDDVEVFTATVREREFVSQMGERAAVACLRMPKQTLARIGAGWRVRRATLELFRRRLEEHGEAIVALTDGSSSEP